MERFEFWRARREEQSAMIAVLISVCRRDVVVACPPVYSYYARTCALLTSINFRLLGNELL